MNIVPVLDLMNGLVVHGIKGDRAHYQPVKSILTPTAEPVAVAQALQTETGCKALYIADLDAIQGVGDNNAAIKKISTQLNVELWVDAGTATPGAIQRVLETGGDAAVIGSETLGTMEQLNVICNAIPREKLLFSIDITKGFVRSPTRELQDIPPLEAVSLLTDLGLDRFILLTLDAVGTAKGPDQELIYKAKQQFPSVAFTAGGGVKTPAHLKTLASIGAESVLVATSLHRGWINKEHLVIFDRE